MCQTHDWTHHLLFYAIWAYSFYVRKCWKMLGINQTMRFHLNTFQLKKYFFPAFQKAVSTGLLCFVCPSSSHKKRQNIAQACMLHAAKQSINLSRLAWIIWPIKIILYRYTPMSPRFMNIWSSQTKLCFPEEIVYSNPICLHKDKDSDCPCAEGCITVGDTFLF